MDYAKNAVKFDQNVKNALCGSKLIQNREY